METLLKDSLKKSVRRGDVWIVTELVESYKGIIKGKRRLVIIVSSPIACKNSLLLQFIPMTKLENKEGINQATQVAFYKDVDVETGINNDSMALCEQLQTINREELLWRIGKVSDTKLKQIEEALATQLSISTYKSVTRSIQRYIDEIEELDRYLKSNFNEETLQERNLLYKYLERYCKDNEVKLDISKYLVRGEDNAISV